MQSREEMKNTAIYEKLINAVKQYFAHKDIYSMQQTETQITLEMLMEQ